MGSGDQAAPIVFSEEVVAEEEGRYIVEIPSTVQEADVVDAGATFRVALISNEPGAIQNSNTDGDHGNAAGSSGSGSAATRTAPVSVDETLSVTITADGARGDGVAKVNGGFVVFVPETSVGDEVLIRVTEVKGTYAQAEVIKRLE